MRFFLILLLAFVMYAVVFVTWKRHVDRRLDAYRDAILRHAASALRLGALAEFEKDGVHSERGAGIWDAASAIDPDDGNITEGPS